MVGFRADVGYFEHRVLHDLLLQSQVILDFARLLDPARKHIELGRWSRARGQVCIYGEDWVRQVAECGEERRGTRSKRHVRVRQYVVMEHTEPRAHDGCSASVELPGKADPGLEVLF